MALLFLGLTKCSICGEVIEKDDPVVCFPHFVVNEKDPLYRFTDSSFHERCFVEDADAERAEAVSREHRSHVGSWPELPAAIAALEDLQRSGDWEGPALVRAIDELRAYK